MHAPSLHLGSHLHLRTSRTRTRATAHVTDDERRTHDARVVAGLLVAGTAVCLLMWVLAVAGLADASWWPALVIAVVALIGILGAVAAARLDR